VLYVLLPQFVQVSLPVTALYLPATQFVHAAPFGPVDPGLQRQEVILVCLVNACPEFDGQGRQALLAVVAEYVLAPQSTHAALPATALYVPWTH